MIRKFMTRVSMKPRFCLDIDKPNLETLLLSAYKVEVRKRGREYIGTGETEAVVSRLAEILTSPKGRFGVILCGAFGNGKTTMLRALSSTIALCSDCGMWKDRMRLSVVDADIIAERAKDQSTFADLCKAELLGIEDMGTEPAEVLSYGNAIRPMSSLLEKRYVTMKPTYITTNMTPTEIKDRYGNRLADRFNEMMDTVVFRNKSFRR